MLVVTSPASSVSILNVGRLVSSFSKSFISLLLFIGVVLAFELALVTAVTSSSLSKQKPLDDLRLPPALASVIVPDDDPLLFLWRAGKRNADLDFFEEASALAEDVAILRE